ncbi:MAG: uncharacterized membrane protein YjgN (DUF898 family) [Pseudohongiellaceae bacterium]|jgi:uncharacterized membrane protein YjgN (DUF898 family)
MESTSTSTQQPQSDQKSSTVNNLRFDFRGDGTEYFKIWIVNLLLTIVTFGIYSAWAKVRNTRYFYSNLYLDGNNFRYLAKPLTILKGRIIAVIAFVIYSYISQQNPIAGIILAVLLLIAMPYLINKSLAFNHRMSAYKNIQFRFHGRYGEAFMAFFVWPLIGLLSFGILYPMALLKINQFLVNNSAYGTSRFEFSATYKDYGIIFLIMLGVGITIGLPIWGISALLPSLSFITPVLMVVIYFALLTYFYIETTNLFYRSLSLNQHSFKAELTLQGAAKVFIINAGLTIVTLGLYLPAAKVRMTKYLCNNITMQAHGTLDNFAAAENENISALGEEFGEVFDFGL